MCTSARTAQLNYLLSKKRVQLKDLHTSLLGSLLYEREQLYRLLELMGENNLTVQEKVELDNIGQTLSHLTHQIRIHHRKIVEVETAEKLFTAELLQ